MLRAIVSIRSRNLRVRLLPGELGGLGDLVAEDDVRPVHGHAFDARVHEQQHQRKLDCSPNHRTLRQRPGGQRIWCSSRFQRVRANTLAPAAVPSLSYRPVHDEGLAFHVGSREEAPIAAVLGVVAIIAHHEEVAGRNRHRAVRHLHVARRELVGVRRAGRLEEVHVRFVEHRAVDVDALVAQLEGLAGQADDALDEVALRVLGVLEDHDLSAPHVGDGQQGPLERGGRRREHELVHQQVIADEQVVLHRSRRDLEGLHDPRAHEQRQDHGHHDRLEVLARVALPESAVDGGGRGGGGCGLGHGSCLSRLGSHRAASLSRRPSSARPGTLPAESPRCRPASCASCLPSVSRAACACG